MHSEEFLDPEMSGLSSSDSETESKIPLELEIRDDVMKNLANKSTLLSNPKMIFPKKEQGIILYQEDIDIVECVLAISEYVARNDIRYIERISNSQVCIFLATKRAVDDLISKREEIQVRDVITPIRKLIAPAKLVIITGGMPIIPHIDIETELVRLDIKMVTGITFIEAGIKHHGFEHIHSFKRQFYADIEKNKEIPRSIKINFNGDAYRLFLKISDSCYNCHKEDHLAEACPISNNTTKIDATIREITPNHSTAADVHTERTNEQIVKTENDTKKRDFSYYEIFSESEEESELQDMPLSPMKSPAQRLSCDTESPKLKKAKKCTPTVPLGERLQPLREIIARNPEECILNYQELEDLVKKTKGSKNVLEIARKYTDDTKGLIKMLKFLHHEITDRGLKTRFTNIIVRLKKNEPSTSSDQQFLDNFDDFITNNLS